MSKWTRLFDWGSDELLDVRHVGARQYQFVRITDMDAACGSDNEGRPTYAADLALIDLDSLSPSDIKSVLDSCGWAGMEGNELALAECTFQYGHYAPLWQDASNNWNKLLRAARREANELLDANALDEAMARPVNALGSTAAEYMRGDFHSAMERGVLAGAPNARIVAKMHGVDQWAIDDARPADFLPYVMGYMAAMNGGERETNEDLAPEYTLGYERGERVRKGEAPAPRWIK